MHYAGCEIMVDHKIPSPEGGQVNDDNRLGEEGRRETIGIGGGQFC